MAAVDLTPTISVDALKTCLLCRSESAPDSTKNGNVRVESYRSDGSHAETLANLIVAKRCAAEIQELVDDLTSVHAAVTADPPEEALWVAEECGFCGDPMADEHYRTSAGVIIHDSGELAVKKEVLLCTACTGVFCEFLRTVGRDGR
jgi:hypothetical protein